MAYFTVDRVSLWVSNGFQGSLDFRGYRYFVLDDFTVVRCPLSLLDTPLDLANDRWVPYGKVEQHDGRRFRFVKGGE